MSETAAEEIQPTAVHEPGTAITPYAGNGIVEEYRPRIVMQPEEAKALDKQLRDCMLAVLREGVDYGTIPGAGDKKNLLKPGAEKLLQWFGFGFTNERDEIERDGDGNRIGVTYRCTVFKEMPDGRKVTVATCEGYTGYDEDRYYTSAEDARVKAEANERKWARKDNRQPKPEKWENAAEYKAPWNTLLKMAQKRALVGAAIDATAAAGLFTQDMEDMKGAAPDGSAFIAAADAAIMALPDAIRNAVDKWYHDRKWPDPAQWTPEQWCAALQAAGYFSGQPETPGQPAAEAARPAAPAANGKRGHATAARTSGEPGSAKDGAWLADALAKAPQLPTAEKCREMWREAAAKVHAGEITKADAERVQALLRPRLAELDRKAKQQPAAPALDPEDPWAAKVDGLTGDEEAVDALAELAELARTGNIDEARVDQVTAAIVARFPHLAGEARAAA